MCLLKISREANASKRDNLIDAIGYLGTVDMVQVRARGAEGP